MKIKLTKRQVIRALETEPLKAGSYVHQDSADREYYDSTTGKYVKIEFTNNTKCPVCAVGALLDCSIGTKETPAKVQQLAKRFTLNAGLEACDFNNYLSTRQVIAEARKVAREGKYLSALSGLFEELSGRDGYTTKDDFAGYRLRNILVQFVKSEFPTKLVLETGKKY